MIDKFDLGERIRQRRMEMGLSWQNCAHKVGITWRYWAAIERGEKVPKMETFVAMLNVLEISSDQVLQNSLVTGYVEKSSPLAKRLEELPLEQRAQAVRVLETLLDSVEKK